MALFMKKKNMSRKKVQTMFEHDYEFGREDDERIDEEPDVIGRCEECGELIYEDNYDAYVSESGDYFCDLECLLNYYHIRRADDCL